MKKVSIIIPVFNVEKYIKKSIESIIGQNYSNLEIILIDDGSTDKSGEICDYYCKIDDRIKVIHQKNQGVGKARNVGLMNATGEYITFLDPDDFIDTNMYRNMVELLERGKGDIVCSAYNLVLEDKIKFGKCRHYTKYGIDAFKLLLEEDYYTTSVWNKIFKRNVIINNNEIKFFPEDIKVGEDMIWLYNVLSSDKLKVYFIPEPLYNWVVRPNSAIRKKDNRITCNDRSAINVCDIIIQKEIEVSDNELIKLISEKKYVILLTVLKDKFDPFDQECVSLYKQLNVLRKNGLNITIRKLDFKKLVKEFYWEIRILIRKSSYYIKSKMTTIL